MLREEKVKHAERIIKEHFGSVDDKILLDKIIDCMLHFNADMVSRSFTPPIIEHESKKDTSHFDDSKFIEWLKEKEWFPSKNPFKNDEPCYRNGKSALSDRFRTKEYLYECWLGAVVPK